MANPGRFGRYDGWYLAAISNDPCKVSMRNVTSMTYISCCIQFLQPISYYNDLEQSVMRMAKSSLQYRQR